MEYAAEQSVAALPLKIPILTDNLLQKFQDQYESHTPYVILPPNTTAYDLCQSQPWLYKAIAMLLLDDRDSRTEAYKELTSAITSAMLIRAEKSLDMLRCLLVLASW